MKHALLLGNGLNRLAGGVDWAKLLQGLVPPGHQAPGMSSLTMEFEKIYAEWNVEAINKELLSKYEMKKWIRDRFYTEEKKTNKCEGEKQDDNCQLLRDFTMLPVKHILTTNYDYDLEKAIDPDFKRDKSPAKTKERLCSLKRKLIPDGRPVQEASKVVWHIHGEIGGPESICLGYEHYCAQLAAMRQLLTTPNDNLPGGPYLTRFLEKGDFNPNSWLTLFFTHNIHIIGLSLSFLEIDLWWLLTYRHQYQLRHSQAPKNKIIYYCPSTPKAEKPQEEVMLMPSLGVEVMALGMGLEDWNTFYSLALAAVHQYCLK